VAEEGAGTARQRVRFLYRTFPRERLSVGVQKYVDPVATRYRPSLESAESQPTSVPVACNRPLPIVAMSTPDRLLRDLPVGSTPNRRPRGEESAIPKVFVIREIELRSDADPNEYERFCRDNLKPELILDGWTFHLLRGDRGRRDGKYAWLVEVESTDARDRYFPAMDQPSVEMARGWEEHPEMLVPFVPGTFVEASDATDYLDISD